MLKESKAYSGFAVSDIAETKRFYGETLGLEITDSTSGSQLRRATGGRPPGPDL